MFGSMPEIPETHEERLQFLHTLGQLAAQNGEIDKLRQIFFISQGWMSIPNDDDLSNALPFEDPNHKEVLMISGLDIQKQVKYLKIFEMLRDKEEKLIGLREVVVEKEFDLSLLEAFRQGFQGTFGERLT